MTMAVYGGVAVVGQAVSPSKKMAMIIRVFMVVPVRRLHSIMSVMEGKWGQSGKILGFHPLTSWLVCRILPSVENDPES
jgi:hypothetical protein